MVCTLHISDGEFGRISSNVGYFDQTSLEMPFHYFGDPLMILETSTVRAMNLPLYLSIDVISQERIGSLWSGNKVNWPKSSSSHKTFPEIWTFIEIHYEREILTCNDKYCKLLSIWWGPSAPVVNHETGYFYWISTINNTKFSVYWSSYNQLVSLWCSCSLWLTVDYCIHRYRAPECLLTDGYYTYKMDIWSVGCVFFEILRYGYGSSFMKRSQLGYFLSTCISNAFLKEKF